MNLFRFYSGTSPGGVVRTGRKMMSFFFLSFFLSFFLLSMHLSVSNQYKCEDIGSPESLSECNPAASGSSLSAFLADTTIYGIGDTCMIDEFDEPIFTILSQDCNEVCVQVNYPAEFVAHGTPVILNWEQHAGRRDTVYGDSILCYTFGLPGLPRTSMVCATVDYIGMEYECCLDVFLDSLRCDFEVRELIQRENGQWELCVRSLDTCADTRKWNLTLFSSGSSTGQEYYVLDPDTCFLIDSGINNVVVQHGVGINGVLKKIGCFDNIYFNYFADCPYCFLDVLREDSCSYKAKINVCDSLNTHGMPYWISFGDGSPSVYTDTTELIHEYNGPGQYRVCITYVSSVSVSSGEEPIYSTCCKELDLSPSDCCPYHLIDTPIVELIDQLCDTALCFQINYPDDIDTDSTLKVFWGDADNSMFVFEGDSTHCINYGGPGLYEVCAVYVYSDTTRTCCYSFELIEDPCPDSSTFEFDLLLPSPEPSSCLNQYYTLSGFCDKLGVRHRWILDDGRIFETNNPPSPFVFSNFVNLDDSVCVTHELIFCDDTMRTTKCLEYPRHAILGRPGDTTRLTDRLLDPNHFGWTVEAFIKEYSTHSNIPLVIDGILLLDKVAYFKYGIWNMGWDSEILNNGKVFQLDSVKIQVADRNEKGGILYSGCCRWRGVKSVGSTRTFWKGATISDAQIMLNFPEYNQGQSMPRVIMEDGEYFANIFGIKSVDQPFLIPLFSNNEFRGGDHADTICDCSALNAIDVRTFEENSIAPGGNPLTATGIQFPDQGGTNLIHHYEQGFHFENTNLKAFNFKIDTLGDYDPVPGIYVWAADSRWENPPNDVGIGIDFDYFHVAESELEFDRMHFSRHNIGVSVLHENSRARHVLKAEAGVKHSSILMENLREGYNVKFNRGSHLAGTISGNKLDTISRSGIKVTCYAGAGSNTIDFDILENTITVGGASDAGGISFVQPFPSPYLWSQHVNVGMNRLNITAPYRGYGIFLSQLGNNTVWNNIVTGSSAVNSLHLNKAPNSLIKCNEAYSARRGLYSIHSYDNELSGNTFDGNLINAEFMDSHIRRSGMNIFWNAFTDSDEDENVIYHAGVRTGVQHHNQYNSWSASGMMPQVVHLGSLPFALDCQLWYPNGANIGSQHFPYHDPEELFIEAISDSIYLDTAFCVIEDSTVYPVMAIEEVEDLDTLYSALLEDSTLYEGYSNAMTCDLDLQMFRMIKENPDWLDSSQTIADFYYIHDTGYIGALSRIEDSMNVVHEFYADLNTQLDPYFVQIKGYRQTVDTLYDQFTSAVDSLERDSLAALLEIQYNYIDAVIDSILQIQSNVDSIINDLLEGLITMNGNLPDTADHQWTRKTMNDIVFRLMRSDSLSAADTLDLVAIAEYCYSDGGNVVFDARALIWALLDDIIFEENCVVASPLPSSTWETQTSSRPLSLMPNPASNEVYIIPVTTTGSKQVQIDIFTMGGKNVRSVRGKENDGIYQMNVSGLPAGVYFIRWKSGALFQTGKLIIK